MSNPQATDMRAQVPPETIDVRQLNLATSVEEASYTLTMTPAMRMSYMEKKIALEKQIREIEEQLKAHVAREKQKLKEMNAQELRMSQEIDAGKLQVEGKQYTIMYQEMGKAGVYDEKGNRISWRYMGVNEFQMNMAIEAERADINMEDAQTVDVDLHAGQSMDLGDLEQGLTTEDLTLG